MNMSRLSHGTFIDVLIWPDLVWYDTLFALETVTFYFVHTYITLKS